MAMVANRPIADSRNGLQSIKSCWLGIEDAGLKPQRKTANRLQMLLNRLPTVLHCAARYAPRIRRQPKFVPQRSCDRPKNTRTFMPSIQILRTSYAI